MKGVCFGEMIKNNVLVVDDDKEIVDAIDIYLRNEGINVIKAYDGIEALEALIEKDIHLILMDIMMPKMDGLRTTMRIRQEKNIPIILISAKSEDTDKILGLNMGADDYITKPFNLKILLLKVKKLLKLDDNNIYKFESLSIDIKKGEINISGESIELTRREIQFLEYMIKNKGIIFSRDYLLNEIWGFDFEGDDRVVDTLVKRIRKKLGDYNFLLKTIRGMGYSFDENKN